MKIIHLAKSALVIMTLFGVIACSSTSDEADQASQSANTTGNSGIDETTRRTQELAEEARQRAAQAQERIERAALNTNVFYFDFDVAEFRSADRAVLTIHAKDLAANSRKSVRLEGHADERGTREYNLALGERRAAAIQNYLIVNGASRSQIEIVSYGEERPEQRGQTDRAYQQNRRVEIMAR